MSKDELTLFSYEILGLVGRGGAGAHDLLQMARRDRMLAWAGESQYYVEPKRLAKLGYLDARREPGRTRERTVYSLTEKGFEALRAYGATPVRFNPVKSEALLRLLIADLVGEAQTRASIATLREDLADLSARARRSRSDVPRLAPTPAHLPAAQRLFSATPARAARGLDRRGRARVESGAYAAEARPATKRLTTTVCLGARLASPRDRREAGVRLEVGHRVTQVPSSQEARYVACSSVSSSIATPIVASLSRAISSSISVGTS